MRHCRATVLKDKTVAADGCIVVHAHDFEPELYERARAVAVPSRPYVTATASACPPVKSGAHRLVVLAAPPDAAPATKGLVRAMQPLTVANDFSVCAWLDARATKKCLLKSNKYAVVLATTATDFSFGRTPLVVAIARDPRERYAQQVAGRPRRVLHQVDDCLTQFASLSPSCFQNMLFVDDDADVAWFCGDACAGVRGDAAAQVAWRRAKERFLLVGLSDRPTATAAELERLLPSHFLRLSRHHRGRDGPRRRAPAKVDRAREAAFVAANAADAAFYELAREAFMGRRLACHGNSS